MNFNLTKRQKDSLWIITVLLAVAAAVFTGAATLATSHIIVSVLLFICGLVITAIPCAGIYFEFIEKAKD